MFQLIFHPVAVDTPFPYEALYGSFYYPCTFLELTDALTDNPGRTSFRSPTKIGTDIKPTEISVQMYRNLKLLPPGLSDKTSDSSRNVQGPRKGKEVVKTPPIEVVKTHQKLAQISSLLELLGTLVY